jgi:hypothetical protein
MGMFMMDRSINKITFMNNVEKSSSNPGSAPSLPYCNAQKQFVELMNST